MISLYKLRGTVTSSRDVTQALPTCPVCCQLALDDAGPFARPAAVSFATSSDVGLNSGSRPISICPAGPY